MIFKMKRYKRMGLREIARKLNEKGVPTARGCGGQGRMLKRVGWTTADNTGFAVLFYFAQTVFGGFAKPGTVIGNFA